MASSMSASDGRGISVSSETADMICPDWQYPHWATASRRQAPWTAWATLPEMPSMVTTSRPGSAAAGVTHERAARPSMWTVHAPHCAMPHPYFVPVRPSSSRSTHRSGTSLPASTVWLAPLIVKVTIIQPPGPVLTGPRQSHELPLHRVDLCQVAADGVGAARIAGGQPEAAACEGVARSSSTEVDDGGEILLLLERGGRAHLAPHRRRDTAIQESGGHLDGVARPDAGGGARETPPSPPLPRAHPPAPLVGGAVSPCPPERR